MTVNGQYCTAYVTLLNLVNSTAMSYALVLSSSKNTCHSGSLAESCS